MKLRIQLMFALVAGLTCGALEAIGTPAAHITKAGVYVPSGAGRKIEAPGTSAGYVTEGGRTFQSSQTRVEMRRGVAFGFDFKIEGAPTDRPLRLTHLTVHPLMTRPDGTVSRKETFMVDVPSEDGTISGSFWYTLSQDFELVPGEWTLSVLDGERVLVEKSFTIVASALKDTPNNLPEATPGRRSPEAPNPSSGAPQR